MWVTSEQVKDVKRSAENMCVPPEQVENQEEGGKYVGHS
jgi:hypothetical protein